MGRREGETVRAGTPGVHRREALRLVGATALGVMGFPAVLRAQPPTVKIGLIHPVSGPLAEPGQACRLGAQLAAEHLNAAGGIKALGGARIELLLADTQSKPEVARTEAERLINAGAVVLQGPFSSADAAAIVPVVQQRRIPFLVDIAAADPITANVAKAVREGQQKTQFVYRNFPTGTSFGRRAVQYFDEIFKEAGVSPKRVVVMHANDLFGQTQARGFLAAHKAASPAWDLVDVIPWPEPPTDLSTEVTRAKSLRPDIIAPITRPASAQLLLPELARQRVDVLGIVSPGSPGLYEAGQIAVLKDQLEYVLDSVPWPDFRSTKTQRVAEEYGRRSGGKILDTNSGYPYDGMQIVADALERAGSTDPDAVVQALRQTRLTGLIMLQSGPAVFDAVGDNPNAIPVMIQVLKQKPVAVWPKDLAAGQLVFPRPKR